MLQHVSVDYQVELLTLFVATFLVAYLVEPAMSLNILISGLPLDPPVSNFFQVVPSTAVSVSRITFKFRRISECSRDSRTWSRTGDASFFCYGENPGNLLLLRFYMKIPCFCSFRLIRKSEIQPRFEILRLHALHS